MTEHRPSTLVLGVGNVLCTDEGVGIHLAHRAAGMPLSRDVEVLDGGTAGFELLPECRGRKKIILIDAIQTDDPPGTVVLLHSGDVVLNRAHSYSAHQNGLEELLRFLPTVTPVPEVVIVGIVPRDVTTPGTNLTDAVNAALGDAMNVVLRECGMSAGND